MHWWEFNMLEKTQDKFKIQHKSRFEDAFFMESIMSSVIKCDAAPLSIIIAMDVFFPIIDIY